MKRAVRFLLISFVIFGFVGCQTTIYIVRHAEKQSEDDAALLSEKGHLRALRLKAWMVDKNINAVYASSYGRTQQTAQPTAEYFNKDLITYGADTSDVFIRSINKGNRNLLVVGHTTNIPVMVRELTDLHISIGLAEFGNIYVLKTQRWLLGRKTKLNHYIYE